MRHTLKLAVAAAALTIATPSFAGVNVNFVDNGTTVPGTIFADYNSGGDNTPYVPGSPNETTSGANVVTLHENTPGVGIGPNGDSTPFLSILGGGFYNVIAPAGTTMVSFLVGTLDAYNTVTLTTNLGVYTLMGGQIFGFGSVGSGNLPPPNSGAVTYTFGAGEILENIMFSSTQTAFEIDSLAFGAPEPAAWLMMILGFGLAGSALRRRKRKLAIA